MPIYRLLTLNLCISLDWIPSLLLNSKKKQTRKNSCLGKFMLWKKSGYQNWFSEIKKTPARNTLHSFKHFFLLFGIQKVQIERNSNKINIHLPSLMSHDMINYLNSWAGSKATGSYKSECSWWIKVCSKSNSTWNKYAEYLVREQVQLCIHLSSVFNSTTNDSFFKT